MKKLFSLFVALTVATTLFASNVITYTATSKLPETTSTSSSGLHTNAFNVTISSHTFSNGIGTITFSREVTTIGNYAFNNCSGLTSVTIPNSVTTIGVGAFENCKGLTSVTIPNSVTTIGNYAFDGCSGLTSPVYNANCFAYMPTSYQGAYTIPDGIKQIAGCAFSDCIGLTSVTIPNSVTTIAGYAFYDCSGLTSVTIPNSVTTIEMWAFSDCIGLTSVTIPNSVTTIGYRAFSGCSGLTSVTIPNSVTTIGEMVFDGCSGLTSPVYNANCFAYMPTSYTGAYTIPDGIQQIAGGAFLRCKGLTSVTIPNSVTTIGEMVFEYCSGLTSVTIPNSVTTIGLNAFDGCSGLTSVTIPNSVTTIRVGAFYNCSGLTSVTIPSSVTTIGDGAFRYVNNIVYSGTATGSPWGAKCVNGYVDGYLVYSDATKTTLCGCFTNATGAITIPNSVTTIGEYAFYNCKGLTSVTIPNSVTTIEMWAFSDCKGLTSVTCYATTPPTCGNDCFYNVSKSIPVYVPARSIDAYKQANKWKEFTNIQDIKQGQCGEDLYWEYNDGILVISGIGAMYDYTQGTAPWMPLFKDSISSLVINNGCTSIGNFAFYGLSNKNLKTIDIPNSVEQIGQYAFANCEYVKNLYLGLSLEKIAANAFANDERLIYITCYAIEPPLLDESAFANYDIYLKVPCDVQDEYKVAKGWKKFNKENVSCIGAEEKSVATDEVTVAPEANQATFTWPQNDQAAGYSIEITKDGVVFCTLKFNAQGQLAGIAFAPSRGGQAREMASAMMTANGWQFTVTGLNQASKYGYTLDALNASQQSIKHYEGEFATDGYVGLYTLPYEGKDGIGSAKFIHNNQLLILHNGNLYNALGGKVR